MRVVLAAVLMGCLGLQPSIAENRFLAQQGIWTVANWEGACIASSRSFAETNLSPVASVRFIMEADTNDIFLETYFWPGAFVEGQATTLTIVKRRDAEVVVPATAATDYSVKADRPFSRKDMKVIRNERLVGVKADSVVWPIGVEASGFDWALYFLRDCARAVQED